MVIKPPYFNISTVTICFGNLENNIDKIHNSRIKINNIMKIRIMLKIKNYSSYNSLLR